MEKRRPLPIRPSARWKTVLLEPVSGVVARGVFLGGELLCMIDEPSGQA